VFERLGLKPAAQTSPVFAEPSRSREILQPKLAAGRMTSTNSTERTAKDYAKGRRLAESLGAVESGEQDSLGHLRPYRGTAAKA
jgi:hypothetical protein